MDIFAIGRISNSPEKDGKILYDIGRFSYIKIMGDFKNMFAVIMCTTPQAETDKIARTLVEEKLVACVNINEINSLFRWEGRIEEDKEALLIMKTKSDKVEKIIERIKELHSYEVPEIIALPIIDGNEAYLNWVSQSLE